MELKALNDKGEEPIIIPELDVNISNNIYNIFEK